MDHKLHPLLLIYILQDVLALLNVNDQKRCRLVCRLWNMEAFRVLRLELPVTLKSNNRVLQYVNDMKHGHGLLHVNFKICGSGLLTLTNPAMEHFWNLTADYIKVLELRHVESTTPNFFGALQRLSTLQKLSLDHIPSKSAFRVTEGRMSLTSVSELHLDLVRHAFNPHLRSSNVLNLVHLFQSFPNLQVLTIPHGKPRSSSSMKHTLGDVLSALLYSDGLFPRLKIISATLPISTQHLSKFTSNGYPFEYLDLILEENTDPVALMKFFMSVRYTLLKLKISFPSRFDKYPSFVRRYKGMKPQESIVLLQNLKSLSVTNFDDSVNLVERLPKLETMELTRVENGKPSIELKTTCHRTHNLKSLLVHTEGEDILPYMSFGPMLKVFPALTRLKVDNIDDLGLLAVYQELGALCSLEVSSARITDAGLTGIPANGDKREHEFIGSLKYLKKLSIEAKKVTNDALIFGIGECGMLQELFIASPLITNYGINYLLCHRLHQLRIFKASSCERVSHSHTRIIGVSQSVSYTTKSYFES